MVMVGVDDSLQADSQLTRSEGWEQLGTILHSSDELGEHNGCAMMTVL